MLFGDGASVMLLENMIDSLWANQRRKETADYEISSTITIKHQRMKCTPQKLSLIALAILNLQVNDHHAGQKVRANDK